MRADELFAAARDLLSRRELQAAIAGYNAACGYGYDASECAAGRWQCWMLLGEFEKAWLESDSIAASGRPDPNRFWNGEPWHGKRVLVRCLHGLGDTIQFIRYAPLLRQTCSQLTVQTHPELVRLLSGVPGIDRVVTWPDESQRHLEWDMQMEVTELPFAFRTQLSSLPSLVPYIAVPSIHDLPAHGLGKRIGLVWEASGWNPARSLPAHCFESLVYNSDHQFYSFQNKAEGLHSLAPRIQDILDTAVFIQQMDLVITVDTMCAHLAGALAVPVWILLPAIADWRWMMHRANSPWYPTARLYRQQVQGDWGPVIEQVTDSLRMKEPALHCV